MLSVSWQGSKLSCNGFTETSHLKTSSSWTWTNTYTQRVFKIKLQRSTGLKPLKKKAPELNAEYVMSNPKPATISQMFPEVSLNCDEAESCIFCRFDMGGHKARFFRIKLLNETLKAFSGGNVLKRHIFQDSLTIKWEDVPVNWTQSRVRGVSHTARIFKIKLVPAPLYYDTVL